MPGQLQHIVGAAALGGGDAALELRGQPAGLGKPAFAVAGTAGDVTAGAGHLVPEEIGDVMEAHVARNLPALGGADDLGDVRVHVQPGEFVAAQGQRVEKDLLGEAVAGLRPAVVSGGGGQLVEDIVHAAVFGIEDVLHVLFGFRFGPFVRPTGHAFEHRQRLPVAGQRIHIEHAGHDFVDRVERSPHGFARVQAVKPLGRKCAQVAAGSQFLLARGQRRHHLVALRPGVFVTHRCVSLGQRGEIVAGEVAAQFAAAARTRLRGVERDVLLPPAQWLRGRGEPGIEAEVVHQAVRGKPAACSRDSIRRRRGRARATAAPATWRTAAPLRERPCAGTRSRPGTAGPCPSCPAAAGAAGWCWDGARGREFAAGRRRYRFRRQGRRKRGGRGRCGPWAIPREGGVFRNRLQYATASQKCVCPLFLSGNSGRMRVVQ